MVCGYFESLIGLWNHAWINATSSYRGLFTHISNSVMFYCPSNSRYIIFEYLQCVSTELNKSYVCKSSVTHLFEYPLFYLVSVSSSMRYCTSSNKCALSIYEFQIKLSLISCMTQHVTYVYIYMHAFFNGLPILRARVHAPCYNLSTTRHTSLIKTPVLSARSINLETNLDTIYTAFHAITLPYYPHYDCTIADFSLRFKIYIVSIPIAYIYKQIS